MSGMLRQPRLQVVANGAALPGVVSAELRGSGARQAASFRIEVATGADPGFGLDWWDAQAAVELEIGCSLDGGASAASLLRGVVDRVQADPVAGVLSAEGRDLSARLIDAQTSEVFANQTASDIATTLATRRGLTPVVTATTELVGRYYQADTAHVSLGRLARTRSEWDVLADLAGREGFELFVQGGELHFEMLPDSGTAAPFVVAWDAAAGVANVAGLRLGKLPALARGVQVRVRSWHSKQGAGVVGTAGDAGGAVAELLRPNLTAAAADALAGQVQAELAGQARRLSFTLPGELTLTPRSLVRLEGDVAGWAGLYRVTEVTRRLDVAGGFRQSVSAQPVSAQAVNMQAVS